MNQLGIIIYNIDRRVNYIKYFESFSSYTKTSLPQLRKLFLARIEYDKMKLNNNNRNQDEINNVKQFRRRRGILRRDQLNLIYKWDQNLVKQNA